MPYFLDGKNISNGDFKDANGIQYPPNWLQLSTQSERDALGITWQDDPPPPPPTPEEIIAQLTAAVQTRLDTVAQEKNYDGILSACTYVTSTVPQFATDGQACVTWRDGCWAKCYEVMAEVQAGTRPVPTEAELIAMLPTAPW